jgi:hypothetical protein
MLIPEKPASHINASLIPLMMETEMVFETLGFYPQTTRLVAREDFIEFSHHESFKSYILTLVLYEHYIQSVSKIHSTTLRACSVHKNNEKSLCKCGFLDALFSSYSPSQHHLTKLLDFHLWGHLKSIV